VFIPMAFIGGSSGVIYRQFSLTIVSAMALSVVVAIVLTPALCATFLKPIHKGEHHTHIQHGFFGWFNRVFDKNSRRYQSGVRSLLGRTKRVMLVYLLIISALVVLFMRLPTSFLPEEDQGIIFGLIQLPTGAPQERTLEVLRQVERHFLENEKQTVSSLFTVAGFSFAGSGQNAGLAFVQLKPWDERKGAGASAEAVAGRAMMAFQQIKNANVYAFLPPAVMELGNATGFDLFLQDRAGLGHAALMQARNAAVVERLLEAGADIAARDEYGNTALHHLAMWADRLPAVRLLVEAGADINAADDDGDTALMDALSWHGEENALYFLVLGADAKARDANGKTTLAYYAEGLWRDGERSASLRYRPDVVAALVAAGARPEAEDAEGDSALLFCLHKDPDRALAMTKDLIAHTDPVAMKAVEAILVKERSDEFFRTVDYHAGEIAFAIGLPIVVLGLSVWLREGVFAGNPGGNWMAPVNSVLACASGLALTGAVVIGGGMYGLASSGSSSGGMEAIGIGVATGAGGILGLALGTIAGIIVGLLPNVRNAFVDSGFLYYVPSGISVVVSGAMLASIFK